MSSKDLKRRIFLSLITNDTRYETHLGSFVVKNKVADGEVPEENYEIDSNTGFTIWESRENIEPSEDPNSVDEGLVAFESSGVRPVPPKIVTWHFLDEEQLEVFLAVKGKNNIRKAINELTPLYLKGIARALYIEFMYNIRKFCKYSNFNLSQSGAVLSQFFLAHQYFTHHAEVNAESVYQYFKELTLCHSLPFLPANIKLFSQSEAKEVVVYFCKLYLRNLPLIRFLCLPNFGLDFNYDIEPDPPILKKKKGEKKGKDKKDKKKKKK